MPRHVKLYLTNGRFVAADKHAVVAIVVNNVGLSPPGTVLTLDEFVEGTLNFSGSNIHHLQAPRKKPP